MEDKPHISYSQISTYTSCPAHYLFSYVCGIKIPPKAVMAQGSAVHHALAEAYKYKMTENKMLHADDISGIFAEDLTHRLKTEVELTDKDEPKSKLLDSGVAVLNEYRKVKMPKVKPVAVEQEILMDFKNKDYQLKGYIDLVDKQPKGEEIVDHKLTKAKPNKNILYASEQLATYAMGYRQLYGKKEKKVRFDFLVRGSNPQIITVEKKITNYDIQKVLTNIAYVMQAIENQEFYCFHKPMDAWLCAPDNCAYEERGYHKALVMMGVTKFIEKYGR